MKFGKVTASNNWTEVKGEERAVANIARKYYTDGSFAINQSTVSIACKFGPLGNLEQYLGIPMCAVCEKTMPISAQKPAKKWIFVN